MMLLAAISLLIIGFVWGIIAMYHIFKAGVTSNRFWDFIYRDFTLATYVLDQMHAARERYINKFGHDINEDEGIS